MGTPTDRRAGVARALAAGLLAAAGCGAPAPGEVTGEVTLDGRPLPEGVIRFVPADGNGTTAETLVAAGRFAEKMPPGNYRVMVSSPRLPKGVTSAKELRRGTVDEGAALEELIPERYNLRTELKAEVQPGPNAVRFDLTSP